MKISAYQSHPAWVCGLKHVNQMKRELEEVSHPAWVCGLKPPYLWDLRLTNNVTPCVGVWIETIIQL